MLALLTGLTLLALLTGLALLPGLPGLALLAVLTGLALLILALLIAAAGLPLLPRTLFPAAAQRLGAAGEIARALECVGTALLADAAGRISGLGQLLPQGVDVDADLRLEIPRELLRRAAGCTRSA